jgi:CDP-diacylglycerol--glycerol-3-phosphate 3-phosphatidyltransferase
MISAPFLERVATAPKTGPAAKISDAEYARNRLSGTVWSHGPGPRVYRAILAFGRRLARAGISADALTLTSLLLAAVSAMTAGTGHFIASAFLLLASGACDALDGVVARVSNKASAYGALLDSTVDRLADGLPLLGVVVYYADGGHLVALPALAMIGAFTVSYIRARAEGLGATLPPLFMRRAERVFLLVLSFLLAPLPIPGLAVSSPALLLGVGTLGALSFVGAWSALRSAREALSGPRGVHVSGSSE